MLIVETSLSAYRLVEVARSLAAPHPRAYVPMPFVDREPLASAVYLPFEH